MLVQKLIFTQKLFCFDTRFKTIIINTYFNKFILVFNNESILSNKILRTNILIEM